MKKFLVGYCVWIAIVASLLLLSGCRSHTCAGVGVGTHNHGGIDVGGSLDVGVDH